MNIDPTQVGPDTPVGTKEIATLLGVAEATVKYWRAEPSRLFPAPEPTPCHGRPWWRWATVEAWNAAVRYRNPTGLDIRDAVTSPPPR